jgi:histone-lysine N-methyltransferase SETMAR
MGPDGPDLAPSDYFLFRVMKKFFRGKRLLSDEEVKEAATTWFEEQSKDFFFFFLKSLQQKWAKCIELLGDYTEK